MPKRFSSARTPQALTQEVRTLEHLAAGLPGKPYVFTANATICALHTSNGSATPPALAPGAT